MAIKTLQNICLSIFRSCVLLCIGLIASSVLAGDPQDARTTILSAPFAAQRANFMHAALGIPRLETAYVLPAGTWYMRLCSDHSHSEKGPHVGGSYMQREIREGRRVPDFFLGRYHKWASLELTRNIGFRTEVHARAGYAGWDEHRDHFYFFSPEGTPLVEGEYRDVYGIGATGRDGDLADVVLQSKTELYEIVTTHSRHCVSLAASVKLPLGQPNNLVDAGTVDPGLRLLATSTMGQFTVHINAGGVIPLGEQNLFVKEADVDLDPMIVWGVGLIWLPTSTVACGVQIEGNTSAFSDVPFLNEDPVTALVGIRKLIHNYVIEVGIGAGFDTDTSYTWSSFLSLGKTF